MIKGQLAYHGDIPVMGEGQIWGTEGSRAILEMYIPGAYGSPAML
jgi:hypothetical protein